MARQVLRNMVMVREIEAPTVSKGGIITTVTASKLPNEGVVVEAGPDAATCQRGDKVYFPKYAGSAIELDGKPYRMVCEDDIWLVER